MALLEFGGQRRIIPPGESTIGTDPSGYIVVAGEAIAPQHAILQGQPDGQVVVRKAADHLDVLINGVQLGPQPTPLLHGDKLTVGETELLFVDERRSGSTQYVQAVNPAMMAAAKPGSHRAPTAATGGRLVSLTDGREYTVTGTSLVIGRDAGCDVVLTSKNTSRRHAELMVTPKGYVLIDSSTNGTFVNAERVVGQRLLARGDVIRVGDDEFRFYADVAAPAAVSPPVAAVATAAPIPVSPAPSAKAPPSQVPPAPVSPPRPVTGPPSAAEGASDVPAGAQQRLANTMHGIPSSPPPAPAEPPPGLVSPAVTDLPARSQASAAPAASRPSSAGMLATLLVRSGSLKGHRFPIKVPVVNVGRADYNDIQLPEDSVSTVHAKLQRREGVWVLVDLDSTNGTFVDGERVAGETPLAPGALIRFGEVGTMFEPTDDTVDPARGSSTKMIQAVQLPTDPPRPSPEPAKPSAWNAPSPSAEVPRPPAAAGPGAGQPLAEPRPAPGAVGRPAADLGQPSPPTARGPERLQARSAPRPPANRRAEVKTPARPAWLIPLLVLVMLSIIALIILTLSR